MPLPAGGDMSASGVRWDERSTPYSVRFDDKYFCRDNGYEEGIYVCCGGNALRERFSSLDPAVRGTFTIMETGFGTGLDFCCAWELWDACAPALWTLRFISVELYPLPADQMDRALGIWPALEIYRKALLAQYRPEPGSMGDWSFGDGRVHLTVVFDDAATALRRIKEKGLAPQGADAWFLDGFAPSKNPDMWSPDVFAGMAALSKPGTSVSTFTVAGAVRRGLMEHGFTVRKAPGHGKKTSILTGSFGGVT
jgi:tRNA 5-methylaminomethyl-2-thiouridine biosynthesis bifunctional protein